MPAIPPRVINVCLPCVSDEAAQAFAEYISDLHAGMPKVEGREVTMPIAQGLFLQLIVDKALEMGWGNIEMAIASAEAVGY